MANLDQVFWQERALLDSSLGATIDRTDLTKSPERKALVERAIAARKKLREIIHVPAELQWMEKLSSKNIAIPQGEVRKALEKIIGF